MVAPKKARPKAKWFKEQVMAKKDEGYLLDGSNNRVKSGSGEYVRTGSYDKEADMEAARKKLAQDVQDKLKADKAKDDADFAAEDARSKTGRSVAGKPAKKAPIVTKEELAKSGLSLRDYMNKQRGLTRRDGTAPSKAKSASEYSNATDAMRNKSRAAAANKKSSTTDALRAKSRKEAAFEGAKRMAKTPEGQAKRAEQTRSQAIERVTPEEYLVGGGGGAGLKTLHKAAKNLATPKVREYNPTMLPAPTKRLEYDKKGALEARREAKDVRLKNEVAEENAARYGLNPRAPGYESAARAVRKEMGEKDFSFKKGGSVRGAGIAQRGVRKCKIV